MGKIIKLNSKVQIVVPADYEVEETDDALVRIFDGEKGVGVLQISTYAIPEDYTFILEHELLNFLKSINQYDPGQHSFLEKNEQFVSADFISTTKAYWKVWVYFVNQTAVFITYNCDAESKRVEVEVVDAIVSSIKIGSPSVQE